MSDFKKVDEARRLLGLGEEATLKEIKDAYRTLSLKYHPDRCPDEKRKECEEMFKKISNANEIIMSYCAGYKYSFKREEVERESMDREYYEHLKRFYDGWWGNLDI